MKHLKRTALVLMAAAMAFTATACGSSGGSDAGNDGNLTMQIWTTPSARPCRPWPMPTTSRIPM